MIADARAAFPSDPGDRGASLRERGNPGSTDQEPEDGGEDRPIDPMSGKNTPASKVPEPVSSPVDKRTGASPSCLSVRPGGVRVI